MSSVRSTRNTTLLNHMKPSKKLEGSPLIWDNSHVIEPAPSRCISGTDEEFEVVANYLLSSVAIRWPDDTKLEGMNNIEDFNSFLRNAAHRIAVQMLSAIEYCNEILGDDMKLRQKPGNPCVLQQEQFEGVWTDVFDYALCMGDTITDALSDFSTEQEQVNQVKGALPIATDFWNDFMDRYTGTSASYDPALTITPGNQNTNRAALCAALKEQLDNYVNQSIKAKEAFTEDLSRAGVAIALTMSILAILAIIVSWGTAAPLLPAFFTAAFSVGNAAIMQAGLGISTALLAVWVQKVKDVDGAILADETAKEDILCVWYEALKNEADVSMEDYQTELDMSGSSSNAQSLYQTIKPLIDQELSYAAFLKGWKRQISFGEAGILLDLCTCENYPIEIENFAGYTGTVINFKGVNGSNQAIYELTLPSTGLNPSDAIVIRTFNQAVAYLHVYMKDTQILSGSFSSLQSGGISREDTPGHYDPTFHNWGWEMYATSFPAKIRLTMEIMDPQP